MSANRQARRRAGRDAASQLAQDPAFQQQQQEAAQAQQMNEQIQTLIRDKNVMAEAAALARRNLAQAEAQLERMAEILQQAQQAINERDADLAATDEERAAMVAFLDDLLSAEELAPELDARAHALLDGLTEPEAPEAPVPPVPPVAAVPPLEAEPEPENATDEPVDATDGADANPSDPPAANVG